MASKTDPSTERNERARKYVDAAKSENTRRSYESHINDFKAFCAERRYTAIPAQPGSVVDYITFLAEIGAKFSTIQVKVSALSYVHRVQKVPNPVKSVEVQETMRGIRRVLGMAQKGKNPLVLENIQLLVDQLPEGIRGERDKALLLVGFGGAFRRSELINITVRDIQFERDRAIIHINQSKTDQEGRGMTKVLPILKRKDLCPVTALKTWLREAGISDGVIFRPISRKGTVLNRIMNSQEVARIIKKYAKLAGLDATLFSGHSLRAGYVTEAADHDQPLWKIKQQTGHKSDLVLQRYIRDQGRGSLDATKSVFGD